MCKPSDLLVMVVEPDPVELKNTCEALGRLGITRLLCVETFVEAILSIKENSDIDIIIADFAIEAGKTLGLLLCDALKKRDPAILFILISKDYSYSIVLDSIKIGAEELLDRNREGEIETLMQKWIDLAMQKNITREILYGKTRSRTV